MKCSNCKCAFVYIYIKLKINDYKWVNSFILFSIFIISFNFFISFVVTLLENPINLKLNVFSIDIQLLFMWQQTKKCWNNNRYIVRLLLLYSSGYSACWFKIEFVSNRYQYQNDFSMSQLFMFSVVESVNFVAFDDWKLCLQVVKEKLHFNPKLALSNCFIFLF